MVIDMKCHCCSTENTLRRAIRNFKGSRIAIYDIDYVIEIDRRIANITEEKKLNKNGKRIVPTYEVIPALRLARDLNLEYTVLFSDKDNDYYELYKLDSIYNCKKYVDLKLHGELLVAGSLIDLRNCYFKRYFKNYYRENLDELMRIDLDVLASIN